MPLSDESSEAATLCDSSSQETIRLSTDGVIDYPFILVAFPPNTSSSSRDGGTLQSHWSSLRQSTESGYTRPSSQAAVVDCDGNSLDSPTLSTESRNETLAVVDTPRPRDQHHWIFHHPDPRHYYNALEHHCSQISLDSIAEYNLAKQSQPHTIHTDIRRRPEHVLITIVQDMNGLFVYEVAPASAPDQPLDKNRVLICHGALTGSWVIGPIGKISDGFVYMRCSETTLRQITFIRISQRFYRMIEPESSLMHALCRHMSGFCTKYM
ncbi:hypothetical protein C8R44DRAFT_884553 [Mycena epipterygia]|nr:hypothetical protein C8R44DRAFT_884553 [Mycena epipterygia]